MKHVSWKIVFGLGFAVLISLALLSCGGTKLSTDFDEEAVKAKAEEVIKLLNAKDTEGVHALCTVKMKDGLTDELIAKVFTSIAEGGAFEQVQEMQISGATDKESGEEFAVVAVKAKYALKSFTYTISFTKQMKLAGLYYK